MRKFTISPIIFLIACIAMEHQFFRSAWASDSNDDGWRATFRPGHNLTVLGLGGQSSWRIRKTENIAGFSATEFSSALLIRYSFHINLVGDTGFALGTGLGVFYHPDNIVPGPANNDQALFVPGLAVSFPSLTIAGIHNLNQLLRLGVYLDYAAVYFPELELSLLPEEGAPDEEREELRVALVPDSWAWTVQLDYFASPVLAFSLLGGFRRLETGCLGGCNASTFLNSIQFSQEMWFGGIGLTWLAGLLIDD